MKNNLNKKAGKSGAGSPKRGATQKAKGSKSPAAQVKKSIPAKTKSVVLNTPVGVPKPKGEITPAAVVDSPQAPRESRNLERTNGASGDGALRGRNKSVSPPSNGPPIPDEPQRKVETYLNEKQLDEFREQLLEKRRLLTGDVERLADQALNRKEHGFNEQSTMPIHMADLGSDTWEQDFTLGLLASEQGVVREIDAALRRIEDRTYGICMATDARITVARLRAKPWARYCIEYERAKEEGRLP